MSPWMKSLLAVSVQPTRIATSNNVAVGFICNPNVAAQWRAA